MIIRIIGDNQYDVPDSLIEQLNHIDNRIVELIENNDEDEFKNALKEMIQTVREKGSQLDIEIIKESELIIPPEDLTFEEAKKIFKGEGIIPD